MHLAIAANDQNDRVVDEIPVDEVLPPRRRNRLPRRARLGVAVVDVVVDVSAILARVSIGQPEVEEPAVAPRRLLSAAAGEVALEKCSISFHYYNTLA